MKANAIDLATSRAAVEIASAAFHEALRTNDPEGLLVHVAEDVQMMPPGEPVINGKNAMRDWYAGFLSLYKTSSLVLSNREVFVGDSWAVELGGYEWGLIPTGTDAGVTDCGNYMQVWKLDENGRWKFAREIWNSSTPVS